MLEIKTLRPDAVPAALEKAKQYRLLNEPDEAESICLDILAVEPANQEALITQLLALTDKFGNGEIGAAFDNAKQIVERLDDSYCKYYYLGIIYERRAKHYLKKGGPGCEEASHAWFVKAMDSYDKALSDCDPNNQDATLRWNSCARLLNSNPDIKADNENAEMLLDSYETPH